MKRGTKRIFNIVLICALTLAVAGAAYARYNKAAMVSAVYSNKKASASTMAATPRVYDFGCYQTGDDSSFDATLCLEGDGALAGTLSFTWDSETAQNADIAVLVDGLSPDQNGNYLVNEADGTLTLPFSVIVNAPSRSGTAYLDVAWTPQGAQSGTLFSRYLIALNPYNENAQPPQIIANSTGFLTSSHLAVSAYANSDMLISRGSGLSGSFGAGTVYYTAAYPQGITLIRDSLIHLGATEGGMTDTVIDFGTAVTEDVAVTLGAYSQNCVTTTNTPKNDAALLVKLSSQPPIVTASNPLTVTVTEADSLADAAWNDGHTDGAQLEYKVQRLKDGKYIELENGHSLSVLADGSKITLSAADAKQPAGTYRLVILQTYNGYSINTVEQVFFIDYR